MNKLVSFVTAAIAFAVTRFKSAEVDFEARASQLIIGLNKEAAAAEATASSLYDLAARTATVATTHNRKAQDARFLANRLDEVVNG